MNKQLKATNVWANDKKVCRLVGAGLDDSRFREQPDQIKLEFRHCNVDQKEKEPTRNLISRSFNTSAGIRTYSFGHEPPITKRDVGGQFTVKQAVSSPANKEQLDRRYKLDLYSNNAPSGNSNFKTLESRMSYAGEHSVFRGAETPHMPPNMLR